MDEEMRTALQQIEHQLVVDINELRFLASLELSDSRAKGEYYKIVNAMFEALFLVQWKIRNITAQESPDWGKVKADMYPASGSHGKEN